MSETNPIIAAADADNSRLHSPGAYEGIYCAMYEESFWDLKTLSKVYKTHIDTICFNAHRDIFLRCRGMTSVDAEQMLTEYGPIIVTKPPPIPVWCLVLSCFYCCDPFSVGKGIAENLKNYADRYECDETYSIIRDGCERSVNAFDLVPGDIIHLHNLEIPPETSELLKGDNMLQLNSAAPEIIALRNVARRHSMKAPADCVCIYVSPADVTGPTFVDNYYLRAIEGNIQQVTVNPMDTDCKAGNIILMGGRILSGSCLAVVIRTGDRMLETMVV